MYFSNSHASRDLPIPAIPTTETRCAFFSSAPAWKSSLTRRSSRSRPTNGGSRPVDFSAPRAGGGDTQRAEERDRLRFPLQLVLTRILVGDRGLCGPLRALPDEHRAGLRLALDPRRGVDEVAGDHALPLGAERDCHLAGQDAGTGGELGVELGDGGDQVERRAHRPLGVVLVRDGRAPDRHHRVADELLDRPAVAFDQPAAGVEVGGQQLARVLGVTLLRGRREADEVGEEDGDVAPLGRRGAGAADGAGTSALIDAPHSSQNRAPAATGWPFGQTSASPAPHSAQNFAPARFSAPQAAQVTRRPPPRPAPAARSSHGVAPSRSKISRASASSCSALALPPRLLEQSDGAARTEPRAITEAGRRGRKPASSPVSAPEPQRVRLQVRRRCRRAAAPRDPRAAPPLSPVAERERSLERIDEACFTLWNVSARAWPRSRSSPARRERLLRAVPRASRSAALGREQTASRVLDVGRVLRCAKSATIRRASSSSPRWTWVSTPTAARSARHRRTRPAPRRTSSVVASTSSQRPVISSGYVRSASVAHS